MMIVWVASERLPDSAPKNVGIYVHSGRHGIGEKLSRDKLFLKLGLLHFVSLPERPN